MNKVEGMVHEATIEFSSTETRLAALPITRHVVLDEMKDAILKLYMINTQLVVAMLNFQYEK
jgi:hypothetical protein